MSKLKQKTLRGLSWSFADNIVNKGINFLVGIILARLLTPREFGLIGMILVFIAISQSFINSGFNMALIRKKDCNAADYSTAFFFNVLVGFLFYVILFFSAKLISDFFHEPELLPIIKVLGIVLILNSVGIVQQAILSKKVNFRLLTKISLVSSIVSGIIGIGLAFSGWGVWSLVWKTISYNFLNSLLLWFWNKWRPQLIFSLNSLKEMFGFGSKLLLSSLIYMLYTNVFKLAIGKYFSATELGYFTRADQFQKLPSSNISGVIQRVTYPVMTSIQYETSKIKSIYKRMIKTTMFATFILMIGMAAVAKPLILSLVGPQWLPAVPYLQLLCFFGMLDPLHSLNLNMLLVSGRADLGLKLEVWKALLGIPAIVIGVFLGVKIMIIMLIVNSMLAYFLNSYWSGKLVNYPSSEQIWDIAPSFFVALVMALLVYYSTKLLPFNSAIVLLVQVVLGAFLSFSISKIFALDAYNELEQIIKDQFFKKIVY